MSNHPKIIFNLLFALCFCLAVILPDFCLEFIFGHYDIHFDAIFVLVMLLFGFLLSLNRSKWALGIILAIIFVLIGAEVAHISYFGTVLSPADIHKIVVEWEDIYTSGSAAWYDLWYISLIILLPFVLIISCYVGFRRRMHTVPFIWVLLFACFVPKVERATRKEMKHFLPSPVRYAMHNGLNTFSFYVGNEIWNRNRISVPDEFYHDYQVKRGEPHADTIFIVMGESINPERMSLYGAKRRTTPFADRLSRDKKFYATKAISSGVSTHTSLAFFLNNVREPGHQKMFQTKTSNLFRLAKEQGYKTYFISSQDAKTAYDIGVRYVDRIITRESERILFSQKGDFALLDLVQQLPKHEKKLVFVQTRTAHSPYHENYDKGGLYDVFSGQNDRLDTYDNSLLAFDALIEKLFKHFIRENQQKKSYFIVTSDHGQLLGNEGKWGHNQLDIDVAEVPFWVYSTQHPISYAKKTPSSHYEIGTWVASLMGFEIINSNQGEKHSYFVHGNNFLSNYEFIEYVKEQNSSLLIKRRQFLLDYLKKSD